MIYIYHNPLARASMIAKIRRRLRRLAAKREAERDARLVRRCLARVNISSPQA